MAHLFPLKDVARQAGVGLATVDRVIHERGGVRPGTERRIRQAMDELSRQRLEAVGAGRRLLIDLVMDAPARFTAAVQSAVEAELPALLPSALRIRAHLSETAEIAELLATLRRIRDRGSHGVLLKAPDHPALREAVSGLAEARIPVVTLVTDLPATPRLAYVGLDNRAAGATAAWLLATALPAAGEPHASGARPVAARTAVLVTLSSHRFLGEEQREAGFREALAALAPHLAVVEASEGRGIDRETGTRVRAALAADPAVAAVYSIGGGNRAIADSFRASGRPCRFFVAHDLDADNRALLRDGIVDAVLHHDLHRDMRQACRCLLSAHRILPREAPPALSAVGIVSRFNLPPASSPPGTPAGAPSGAQNA